MGSPQLVAVWVGKLTATVLQLLGRRGNALPGLLVEKAFPGFLPRALAQLPHGVVVVSGTNGKTTTTKMVATILGRHYRVISNDSGSNFVRGVIGTVVEASSWRGRLSAEVAVLELDEAWAVRLVDVIAVQRVLLLNVMRDQLDRFGEIDTTAALLGRVAAAATVAVVLNRDDPRIAALAGRCAAPVSYYGVAPQLRSRFPTDEELYGAGEQAPAAVPEARVELREPGAPSEGRTEITLRLEGTDHHVALRLDGAYNAQNAAGAAALALTFGLSPEQVIAGLAEVEPAFGRGQSFDIKGRRVVLHLVKNPAGFRQSLNALAGTDPRTVVIVINDADADGRDVSWLWDVEFAAVRSSGARVVTAGTRAPDMALRLSYDDVHTDIVEPVIDSAVMRAITAADPGNEVVIFATYTAMWALHPRLAREAAA